MLQPLSGEVLQRRFTYCDDGARLDIVADNFWGNGHRAFFDVRCYEERVQEVE